MSIQESPLTLGTENIRKLLMRYAIPAIVAMTAASLYNMMDSIFIGHGVGSLGIAGLAVTFPFINLAAAFGSLVGVGASAVVSMKMGQKDLKSAEAVLGNVILMNVVIGIVFMAVCLIFLNPILYFFGASEATLPYARDYMKIILYGNLITHVYMGLNEVMRASGYPQRAMAATLFAVAINGVLNALFIFVFDMGIQGAALGTIVAQLLALIGVLLHFSSPKSFIRFQRGIFHIKWHIIRGDARYRAGAFSDEPLLMPGGAAHQQRPERPRWRHVCGCIRNYQPDFFPVLYDRHGIQSGHAAYCGI